MSLGPFDGSAAPLPLLAELPSLVASQRATTLPFPSATTFVSTGTSKSIELPRYPLWEGSASSNPWDIRTAPLGRNGSGSDLGISVYSFWRTRPGDGGCRPCRVGHPHIIT